MGLAPPNLWYSKAPHPAVHVGLLFEAEHRPPEEAQVSREEFPASAMVAGGVPSAGEHDFPATASRNLSLRMPLLLNLSEFEKCSRCSVGYRPTIEAVCIPIDKIVALITESLLL